MDRAMTKQESYIQRRQLFKDIWETAMRIDDKETDIMNKPKVVKTLRMSEIDKCPIGRSKKQRIKNLRHVCNKILDFCNKQEADDTLYEKIANNVNLAQPTKTETNQKKLKKIRHRRKINKSKSLFTPKSTTTVARATTSVKYPVPVIDDSNMSRKRSPYRQKACIKMPLKKPKSASGAIRTKMTTTRRSSPDGSHPKPAGYPREAPAHRRIVKKKRFKKKKLPIAK